MRLHQFERETPGVELYAKAEWQNPGGSVKDRAAARMILDGEAVGHAHAGQDDSRRDVGQHRHRLRDDRRRARLQGEAVPAGERQPGAQADSARARRRARADDPLEGTDGAFARRGGCSRTSPTRISIRISTTTTANWRAHYDTTAPEIIEQTSGTPDAFRRRTRHERHVRRHRPPAAQVQPVDQADFVPARLAVPRPRRAEAHGVGDRARHLRSVARRRGSRVSRPRMRIDLVRRLAREEGCWSAFRRARPSPRCSRSPAISSRASSSRSFPTAREKY